MREPVLIVNQLNKSFRRYNSEWKRVVSWLGLPIAATEETNVINEISFSIREGESVGVVGQNGAGKSTLLKLITGTLKPSSGTVSLQGRVSAILELGLGFSPELTGRQNVYRSAGLMGFSNSQIDIVIQEIEQFAEIGDYFDQPVRVYSSGMQMRVAFSVATAFRPEILIIDEALSVGDTYFQHKSFDRIREFQRMGTTLLFVSHDKMAIQSLCNRAILLAGGRVIKDGDPEAVMDYYNALIAEKEGHKIQIRESSEGKEQTISGSGEATVEAIYFEDEQGNSTESVFVGRSAKLIIEVAVHKDIPRLVLGYMIKDRVGQTIFGTNTHHTQQAILNPKAGARYKYEIGFQADLGPGTYSIATALVSSDTHFEHNYEWKDLALIFSVINSDQDFFIGTAWLPPTIKIDRK